MSKLATDKRKIGLVFLIIFIKLILMGLFSSDYQNKMFIPFVNTFLDGQNPYTVYYENNYSSSFPYFPLMLLIESFGGVILKTLQIDILFLQNLIFKLPLLLFDLIGYWTVRKMGVRFKYAIVFYFASPIIIFSTCIHGQLDIIPTALLLMAIYYATSWNKTQNLLMYSIFLGLAISSKFHIAAAVPILFLYVASKKGYFESFKYLFVSILVIILFCVPFWGEGFINTVLFNKEQNGLMALTLDYGTVQFMISIAVLLFVYAKTFEINYFNKTLLFSLLGLLYAIFLICIAPMPAWYTWIVPFLALYFGFVSQNKYKIMLMYAFFNAVYVIYFVFLHKTEYVDIYLLDRSLQYLKLDYDLAKNIVFTIMTVLLIIIVHKIYNFGIASSEMYQRGNAAFTIGIAGDSGSGKSKLLEKIEHLFGTDRDILFIEGDGDHRWERNDDNWDQYTALDPKANYLYKQAADIHSLRNGNYVERHDYDHDSGTFTERKRINSKKYIVLCGLHSLYLPQLRKELDLKIYMDTDSELRKYWKIQRDTSKRGYSKEEIVEQINKRLPDAKKYIYPQKEYADMSITYFDKTLTNCFEKNHDEKISVRFDLDMNLDAEKIVYACNCQKLFPELVLSDNVEKQSLIFDGTELLLADVDFGWIASNVIPQYEDIFTYNIAWGQDIEGLVQLFILIMISFKMRGGRE